MKTTQLQQILSARRTSWIERVAKANNPALVLLVAFLIVIFAGSFLLWLPAANQIRHASYLNNLFVAVSAVCVTGLSTVTGRKELTQKLAEAGNEFYSYQKSE